ncbi:MAG TPA: PP2C family protein-serine/threonine phosphatase [Ignavibacteria bacterium]
MKAKPLYSNKQLELNSLIEFSQLINSNLNLDFILGNILLSIMGKMMITKAMFLIKKENEYYVKSLKGLSKELLNKVADIEVPSDSFFDVNSLKNRQDFFLNLGIKYFFKIYFSNKLLGILCTGEKNSGMELTNSEIIFIETLLNISATSIENTIKFEEIRGLNKKLDIQVQQITSLFELSKEFTTNFTDSEKIIKLLSYTLLGNYGIQDLLIFSKFNSNKFSLLNKIKISDFINFDLSILEEIKSPLLITHNSKNKFLNYLKVNNYQLLIPVLNKSNDVESVVCLGNRMNRMPYGESDVAFLSSLVNISAISLDNSILFNEYLEKQKIENEINLAKEIQNHLLPQRIPSLNGYEISGKNIPALNIGGDYFDIIKIDDNRIIIIIADVSGKGLPASLLMSNIQSAIHSFFKFNSDKEFNISEVTGKLNSLIYENTSSEKFITFFWGVIDKRNHSFIFSNAGHNPPLFFKKSKIEGNEHEIPKSKLFSTLNEGGLMLGIIEDFQYESGKVKMIKNDMLILYTDGITEAQNSDGDEFGEERLHDIIISNRNKKGEEIVNIILKEVEIFAGINKQYDDQTLIILSRTS